MSCERELQTYMEENALLDKVIIFGFLCAQIILIASEIQMFVLRNKINTKLDYNL